MTIWRRAMPASLSARIVLVMLLALIVSQLVSFFIFMHERDRFLERVILSNVGENVAAATRTLDYIAPDRRGEALRGLSTRDLRYRLIDAPGRRMQSQSPQARGYADNLARILGVDAARVRVAIGPGLARGPARDGPDALVLVVRLDDGRWLAARQRLFDPTRRWARSSLTTLAVSALLMIVVVLVTSRRMTAPLRQLAGAAERFGRGEAVQPLAETGPDEIRRSIAAFNRMRERLVRFVADRSRLIAAIAHDLRTPITALRLRLEFLPEDDNKRAMAATLDDMARMSEASLTFMREDAAAEATRKVDMSALVDALCEDYRAIGSDVDFQPSARITLVCRPVAIRRALRNLIDNALAYGERARLSLIEDGEHMIVEVADDGPGIAEADWSRVFDPFVRLEDSRNRDTGGSGLGLSIARSVAQGHGGRIQLANRPTGGLSASLWLPRDTTRG